MSNAVYPTLPGLTFGVIRSPQFKTDIRTTPSGREYRGAQMQYPLYKYTLTYEVLRDIPTAAEFRTLLGFYNQRQGSFDSFLFQDPDDYSVTAQVFGIGDGVTTQFQLVRTLGGSVEPVYDLVSGSYGVYKNGTLQTSGVSTNATGGITFATAPASGDVLTWSGQYYWRVRFLQDQLDFAKFMNQLWEAKKVEFITVKP